VSVNGLSLNGLSLNGLSLNGLSLNGLSLNGFNTEGEAVFDADEDMVTTADGREVLSYIAKCTLEPGTKLVATYNSVTYEWPGELSLAPGWVDTGLTASEERWISACLLAHVNETGYSVTISVRAHSGTISASASEKDTYLVQEGAFYGNLFGSSTPAPTYACQGDDPALSVLHSEDRDLRRLCTDTTSSCDITVTGRCRDVCEDYEPKYGWYNCTGGSTTYTETVAVYLYADDPDTLNDNCSSGTSCTMSASGTNTAAFLDCDGASDCTTTCSGSANCTIDGSGTDNTVTIQNTAFAEVICAGADTTCDVECNGSSSCEIDCKDADSCADVVCDTANGADCLLDCTDATGTCGFASGTSTTSCSGDIIVAGRSCP
jgi:hypothetical protein